MWKVESPKLEKLIEKYDSLEKVEICLSTFSSMNIEDKIDLLSSILDNPSSSDAFLIIKKYTSNQEIRNLLTLLKSSNNYFSDYRRDKIRPFDEEKNSLEGDIEKSIQACKNFLIHKKIGLCNLSKEDELFFNTKMKTIVKAIQDCVLVFNTFDCNDSILNKIKALEREKRMEEFLKQE